LRVQLGWRKWRGRQRRFDEDCDYEEEAAWICGDGIRKCEKYTPRESPVVRAILMYNWLSALEKLGGMFGSRWDAGVDRRWVVTATP
jgi:hypothetical protein